jgi:hypothetical protein
LEGFWINVQQQLVSSMASFGVVSPMEINHRPLAPTLGTLGRHPAYPETVFYHATAAHDLDTKLSRIATAQSQMERRIFGAWQEF